MSEIIAEVTGYITFKKLFGNKTNDWIDKLNHAYTACLLVVFGMIISTHQFVGKPIHCWVPAQWDKDRYVDYVNSYCWIKNTYFASFSGELPVDIEQRQDAEITYYQWTPLIMLIMALCFVTPHVIWKVLNTGSGLNIQRLCNIADEIVCASKKDRETKLENVVHFLDRWLQSFTHTHYKHLHKFRVLFSIKGRYISLLYIVVKCLFVANIIAQFFILNAFLGMDFMPLIPEILRQDVQVGEWRESPRFPRVTICDYQLRQLQNVQRTSIQCVLPINLFNEKIFIVLWFWLIIVGVLTAINFGKWIYLLVLKRNNYSFVKKYLTLVSDDGSLNKNLCHKFAEDYIKDDGCFVLRMIATNSSDMVVLEIVNKLWKQFTAGMSHNSNSTKAEFYCFTSLSSDVTNQITFKKVNSKTDDFIDKLNHAYTTVALVVFGLIITSKQFVGDPIHCWVPAQYNPHPHFLVYINSYCWIKNTYYIPFINTLPEDVQTRTEEEIPYYQWTPLILMFMAFCFKLPHLVWKVLNTNTGLDITRVCNIAEEIICADEEQRKAKIIDVTTFLDKWFRSFKHETGISRCRSLFTTKGKYLTGVYIVIKFIFLVNVIAQFFVLDEFLGMDIMPLVTSVVAQNHVSTSWLESGRFPRVTLCDFDIRQLQNVRRYTVQCVLPINLFNEKIFIIIWFWLIILGIFSSINLAKWVYWLVIKKNNYDFVKKYLKITTGKDGKPLDKALCRTFANEYIRDDGCFVLRMIAMNSSDIVVMEIVLELWKNYNNTDSYNHQRDQSENGTFVKTT